MKKQWNADEAIKLWEEFAVDFTSNYTSQGDPHREVLLNPVLLELIGPVKDMRILDAGCGEGYLSRILAELGASVVAVDYSHKMIEIAGERTESRFDIKFRHGNIENLDFLKNESFDIVVSNMALMDLPEYELAINEANRLLVHDGNFIFSISHPCFTPSVHGWVKNGEGEKLHWKVDQYFNEGAYKMPFLPAYPQCDLLQFHRTLGSYYRTVVNSGFIVEELVEPTPRREKLEKYPGFIDDFRMSQFLVFKARKQAPD